MEQEEEYIIVIHHTSVEFMDKVNKKIAEGYVPLGGVSVTSYVQPNSEASFRFAQSMIKYK